ncbi:translation initiation factor IF-2, chloroplastic [Olea europaea var. sylvestris]|uniref:translation initiation factor IF-2, chloroplastic n=1 Tax=Olea europaea var. sylvestris TaxID=158386 RepID=UPI000C1D482E|nr:translation initiation factor IF-2, chloroplastic [Olea europaea var. sylvestris]
MASLASLVNLGSVSMISSGHFEGSVCLVRRVAFRGDGSNFVRFLGGKRWRYVGMRKYSVTTNYVTEQGTSKSLDSTRRGSKDNDIDTFLKAAPKPILKPVSKVEPVLNMPWDGMQLKEDSDNEKASDSEEERSKIIESLGEVLEMAEKLEKSKPVVSVNKPPANHNAGLKNGKPVNSVADSNSKSKTSKSVWRKGNPVATSPKVVKEPPRPPQAPQKIQPQLQAKPSVAPPVSVKKPVILKDVNAAAKSSVADATNSTAAMKERKPILIDKFASKKPVVDPLISQAVLAPTKPGKSPPPGKFKDEFRKKGSPSGGLRRRMVDDEMPDEDASELDVSIPGAATARKGRKWTKASRKAARLQAAKDAAPVKVEIMEVDEDGMLTEELAFNLAISEGEILGHLYSKGIKPDGVQKLSKDMVKMICREYEVEIIDAAPVRVEEMAKKKEMFDEDDIDKLEDRSPVLTIMGHVDHGKTTLLDYIRKSKVAASEAGGITQGIGAYKVQVPIDGKPQTCVFLDTPGHEAFGAMRARGARVTDIAVIVVAADDGIRPQTNEAIAHAKSAGVPIVVAINKIDKDGANPDRVMQDLSLIGLMPEEWGGDIPMVKISALKGENVDDLLETIMLVAELQDLKANPHRNAKGTVIEAGLDKSKGPVATFIVQKGTLKRGDVVVCGEAFGKVRALFDDKGKRVDEAGPSMPVQVIGLNNVPLAGDEFDVVGSLDVAREKAELRAEYLRNKRITAKAGDGKVTLSSLASAVSAGKLTGLDLHQLNIILKVDLQGSIEAVRRALQVLPQTNVTLKFLLQATGDVSTSDVDLAVASKAIIFGFNVKATGSIKSYADNKGVEIRLYRVIYELIDDVRNAMEGLLEPVEEQVPIGSAEVRAVFSSGSGRVAGCMVTDGKIVKDSGIRVLRKGKEVHVGVLSSLRRVKELVKEVNAGLECGIGVEEFNDWEEGDSIEAFNSIQKRRTLEEASASMTAALEGAGIEL